MRVLLLLRGSAGCGKSTLLRLMLGFEKKNDTYSGDIPTLLKGVLLCK